MKVIVHGNRPDDMQVTFFITSEEEKSVFHDRVAISICDGSHEFIGHVFNPEARPDGATTYNIPTKEAYTL